MNGLVMNPISKIKKARWLLTLPLKTCYWDKTRYVKSSFLRQTETQMLKLVLFDTAAHNLLEKYIMCYIWCAATTPPTHSGAEKVRGKVLNLLFG